MTDQHAEIQDPTPESTPDHAPAPRTRRSLLTAAAAALGAVAVQSVASVVPVEAATGSTMKAGLGNTATGTTTVKATGPGVTALRGWASNRTESAASVGVTGQSDAPTGAGVKGTASATTGVGVIADGGWIGIDATARVAGGAGVRGRANADVTAVGVAGLSTSGTGVYGESGGANGRGIDGNATGTDGTAVRGLAYGANGTGVFGDAGKIGVSGLARNAGGTGVRGEAISSTGIGVQGDAKATGVSGVARATNGRGVEGIADVGAGAWGVSGSSNTGYGVVGQSFATASAGVGGMNRSVNGVGVVGIGNVTNGYGVQGFGNIGVYGEGSGSGGAGIRGVATSGAVAATFQGDVSVSGTLSKSAGSFVIDHPLDPENRYLAHSFVESPEMLNVYSGTVVLDAKGRATVRLPRWFEALNMEHRYQLTAIGGPAPELHVASEIRDNRFVIAGGAAGQKVCWQVTGVRQDAYARKHRIKVDTPKKGKDKGRYLNPESFGKRRSEAIGDLTPAKRPRLKAR